MIVNSFRLLGIMYMLLSLHIDYLYYAVLDNMNKLVKSLVLYKVDNSSC
jgi:hypothetical protein